MIETQVEQDFTICLQLMNYRWDEWNTKVIGWKPIASIIGQFMNIGRYV